ncbi:hypothetical protein DV738_g2389, partial [Chaetothyriales sp. CBS 135597]
MASNTRAMRAQTFMRQCRQPACRATLSPSASSSTLPSRRQSSSVNSSVPSTPYSPSSFNRPLRSPLNTPPQPYASNIDHLPPPPSPLRQPSSERPIVLPSSSSSWTRPNTTRNPPSLAARSRPAGAESTQQPPANARFTFSNWVRHTLGMPVVAPPINPLPVHLLQNPYRARKKWPPDFHKLHPKQQFHFEKTFRRRALLKWARPNWNKWIKRLQRSMLLTAMLYFLFIAEPDGGTPFDGFRIWFFGKLRTLGALSEEGVEEARRLEEDAKADRDRRLAEKREKEKELASPVWDPK